MRDPIADLHVGDATKAKLRETVDSVLRSRPDLDRDIVELAVLKAWTGTLEGQHRILGGELRLLWERLVAPLARVLRR